MVCRLRARDLCAAGRWRVRGPVRPGVAHGDGTRGTGARRRQGGRGPQSRLRAVTIGIATHDRRPGRRTRRRPVGSCLGEPRRHRVGHRPGLDVRHGRQRRDVTVAGWDPAGRPRAGAGRRRHLDQGPRSGPAVAAHRRSGRRFPAAVDTRRPVPVVHFRSRADPRRLRQACGSDAAGAGWCYEAAERGSAMCGPCRSVSTAFPGRS
jgi:hypothetical protein